jgi:hypothetical protein
MGGYVALPLEIPAEVYADLRQLEPLFAVARQVHALGQRLHTDLDLPERSALQAVAYVISGKAFRTVQSIAALCLCGFGVDALSLCGSLFENLVDLSYMEKAPVLRPRRYTQFEQVEKFYQAEKVLAHKRLRKALRERYRGYHNHLKPQVASLLRYFPKKHLGWAQLSQKQRAKAVGMDVEYEELYWIFCGYKHTLPAAAHGLVIEDGQSVDVLVGPSAAGVFDALAFGLRYTLHLFGLAAKIHGLHIEAEIDGIAAAYINACEQVRQQP